MKGLVQHIGRVAFRRLYLVFLSYRSHLFQVLFSTFSIPIALSILLVGWVSVTPVKSLLKARMMSRLPSTMIKATAAQAVRPADLFSLLEQSGDRAYGISEKKLKRIRQWKEVKAVYATQILQKPVSASLKHPLLGALGGGIRFDIMVQGISSPIIKKYGGKNQTRKLTAWLPETYADLVTSYAMVNGLPVVDLREIPDLQLEIFIGQSIMKRNPKEFTRVLVPIAGYLPPEFVSAVGVPLEWVIRYHREHQMPLAASSYDQIFVIVKSIQHAPRVEKRLKRMGLKVKPRDKQNYNALLNVLNYLDTVTAALGLLILVMMSTVIGNAFINITRKRKYEYGLYIMSGASGFFLWSMIFAEGILWGGAYSWLCFVTVKSALPHFAEAAQTIPFLQTLMQAASQELLRLETHLFRYILLIAGICGLSAWLPSFFVIGRSPLKMIRK